MKFSKITLAAAALVLAMGAKAQNSDPIKIGFITDMSGAYADIDGAAGAEVVKWAVSDFGGKLLGRPIEVLTSDHQNKPDVASVTAREWMDKEKLQMLIGGTNSAALLAMSRISAERSIPFLATGPGTARLTNEECNPYAVHYSAFDTSAVTKVGAAALVNAGYKSWYFLAADYVFGQSLAGDAARVVKTMGGNIVGEVRAPLGNSDYSSFLMQAQHSKAQILALANTGKDFANSMKSIKEFGVDKTMKVAGLLVFINEIHSLGLKTTAGLQLADSWYWDQDEGSRKFSRRFFEKYKRMPSNIQAANYSAATTYLKAAQKAGTTDGKKVMEALKSTRIDDFFNKGYIRADGRLIHDMYLFEVKKPEDSKSPWDYYKKISTVPGEQAFIPPAESKCPLLRG